MLNEIVGSAHRPTLSIRRGLRVLQVICQDPVNYPPTLNVARVLANAGAEVVCLGFDRGLSAALDLPNSVKLKYVKSPRPILAPGLGAVLEVSLMRAVVLREWAQLQPDLVIGYDHWGGWSILPLTFLPRSRTVLHIHDNVERSMLNPRSGAAWAWRTVSKNASQYSLMVVPEIQRARLLESDWGVSMETIVMANSPPRRHPQRNELLKERIAKESGRTPERLAAIVGNMGLYTETVRALAKTRRKWDLVVVGCRHVPSLDAMRQQASELGMSEYLHIIPYTDYDTVATWLQGCDVGFALYPDSSKIANWRFAGTASVKVQEYMAAGTPSIVCSRENFGPLAERTGALEVLEDESDTAIAIALDALEPGSEHWRARSSSGIRAHGSFYNCESQLIPLIERLGLRGDGTAYRGATSD